MAVVLLLGSVGCGCYSLYWFVEAARTRSEDKRAFKPGVNGDLMRMQLNELTRKQGLPGDDLLSGVEMEKYAWKYLCFALLLGFAAYTCFASLRHCRMTAAFKKRQSTDVGTRGLPESDLLRSNRIVLAVALAFVGLVALSILFALLGWWELILRQAP